MSYSQNIFYNQSFIPCNAENDNAAAEAGIAQINIDGKAIKSGTHGKCCHIPGDTEGSSKSGPHLFYAGGGNVRYTANGSAVASTTHAIRSLRAMNL
jgi:hypothetical protein